MERPKSAAILRASRPPSLAAAGHDDENLEAELRRLPPRGSVADPIWSVPSRSLDDGHIELDYNTVERTILPVTLDRKNHPFASFEAMRYAGRPLPRCSPRQSSTALSRLPTSRISSNVSATDIPSTGSTISCPGTGRSQSPSRPNKMCQDWTATSLAIESCGHHDEDRINQNERYVALV